MKLGEKRGHYQSTVRNSFALHFCPALFPLQIINPCRSFGPVPFETGLCQAAGTMPIPSPLFS